MSGLTSLIVDDEPIARTILENFVKQLSNWDAPVSCNNGIEALNILNNGFSPDVIFLDINMPVINGIDFLKTLKKPPFVVFTTAHPEFALDAFELHVIDYLVKPISFERFLKTVLRIQSLHNTDIALPKNEMRDFIFLKSNGKMQKIDFEDILYLEAKGDYVNVCLTDKTLLISMQLKEIELHLPQNHFIRVHRSFIVNVSKINAVFGNTVEVGKREIPISANYKEAFLKFISGEGGGIS